MLKAYLGANSFRLPRTGSQLPRLCPPSSLESPKRVVGYRGGSRYVEVYGGSWFLGFLFFWFLGLLDSWFIGLLVSKYLGFKGS